jgi:IclR family transcriptional regulator, acetate operon repressor
MDVKTASRTVDVFEIFARLQRPLSLSELARELGAPMSSCLYLVRTLENLGFLYAVGAGRSLYPTRKMLNIATSIAAGEPAMQQIEPLLTRLRDETQETVILGKRDGKHIIYLSIFEGLNTIRYTATIGDLIPLHASSIGKAILSAMDPAERSKIIAKLPLDPITAATITDRAVLVEDIKLAADRGYAETRGESVSDVAAIAMPVRFHKDLYAVSIAAPIYRMNSSVIPTHLRHLRDACAEIVKC